MKKLLFIFCILLTLVACSFRSEIKEVETFIPSNRAADETEQSGSNPETRQVEKHWSTYYNVKYGYSINYPDTWEVGEESDAGDGKALYIGNPDVDIRVYAGFYFEQADNSDLTLQNIKLDNGYRALMSVGNEEGKYVVKLSYVNQNEIQYSFYAKVSEAFFKENEKLILNVAKSFDMPE
ncbi:hypothetical protein D3C76_244860 [compost metagenome]